MAATTKKPPLRSDQIILRPLVTEKGVHRSTRLNSHAFVVAPSATKIEIRKAIEELFNVKVTSVNTQNRKGKPRRTKLRMSHTGNWKKAIVKLDAESRIELY